MAARNDMNPVGRFAPSPTGNLHMGSLYVALASYLSVKSRNGRWLLRIDDLDRDRTVPGADRQIIDSLAMHGLHPDSPVIYQSSHTELYNAALARLSASGRLFGCCCSRRDLEGSSIYPGTCRSRPSDPMAPTLRFQVMDKSLRFEDRAMGTQQVRLDLEIGDVVVRRRDASIAYHLACAVDDGGGAVTEVLRGADLLGATAIQINLMDALDLQVPSYGHLPIMRNSHGQKLSKQSFARALNPNQASENLWLCLASLGIPLPNAANDWLVAELIEYGKRHFHIGLIPTELPVGMAE